MKCPNCSYENLPDAPFCENCGEVLFPDDTASGSTAPTAPVPECAVTGPTAPVPACDVTGPTAPVPACSATGPTAPVAFPLPDLPDVPEPPDLSGFEQLVSASYVPPQPVDAHEGDTAQLPVVEEGYVPRARNYTLDDSPKKRNVRKPLIVAAALVLLALLAAGVAWGTYAAELWGGKTVPSVEGLTQESATAELEERGFAVQFVDEKSDEPAGVVLGCDPAAGQRADAGTVVTLSVAVPRVIPEIKGASRAQAQEALAAEGFTAVTFEEKKSNKAEDTVLSVQPEAGEVAPADMPITVKISVPYTVPQVEGLTADEAKKALKAEKYKVTTAWYDTEDVPEGTAVSTEPAAGTKLDSGSKVTLYIARDRGAQLRDLTASILPGATLSKDGATYQVQEVKSVSYQGDNKVSYTVTAKQYEVVTLPFDNGQETYYKDTADTIEGEITWTDADEVASATPSIRY